MKYIGNTNLMDLPKIAFLCSDKYSSKSVLASYDWANEAARGGKCIISGFQSRLERDVLDILLRSKAKVVMVLARCIYQKCPRAYTEAVKDGRLLICSPFDDEIPIVTRERALQRNQLVIDSAEEIIIGHVTEGGMIASLLQEAAKPVNVLDK